MEMDNPLIERLKRFYNNIKDADLNQLDEFYSEKVVFRDPIHEVHGLAALQDYFTQLTGSLVQCQFEYLDQLVTENTAYLKWNMHFRHPRLGGKRISIRGVSQLKFDDVIHYHEDVFDMGAMIYEHVPVVGLLTRWLKRRLAK
jgi:ketosteroid isomerase-like protein